MARCLISPRLLFAPHFSLSSPLAFILYFYPNHHFTPNHRTCLGSPPTSQTKPRIPCYPLSSKNQCKRFLLIPLTLALYSAFRPFSTNYLAPIALLPSPKKSQAQQKLASKTKRQKSISPKKRRIPLLSQFSYHLNPTSPPFLLLSLFSLLKSIAHTYALPLQRPHKHPKKHPLASKKHPQKFNPQKFKNFTKYLESKVRIPPLKH